MQNAKTNSPTVAIPSMGAMDPASSVFTDASCVATFGLSLPSAAAVCHMVLVATAAASCKRIMSGIALRRSFPSETCSRFSQSQPGSTVNLLRLGIAVAGSRTNVPARWARGTLAFSAVAIILIVPLFQVTCIVFYKCFCRASHTGKKPEFLGACADLHQFLKYDNIKS